MQRQQDELSRATLLRQVEVQVVLLDQKMIIKKVMESERLRELRDLLRQELSDPECKFFLHGKALSEETPLGQLTPPVRLRALTYPKGGDPPAPPSADEGMIMLALVKPLCGEAGRCNAFYPAGNQK